MVNTMQMNVAILDVKEMDGMISATNAIRKLRISRMTLYKWMLQGKIKGKRYRFGSRVVLAFNLKEIKRIKTLMVNNRKAGKSILKS